MPGKKTSGRGLCLYRAKTDERKLNMFVPLANRVLIKRKPELSISEGGIIVPETYRDKPMEGSVFSVGEDVTKVKAGNRVLHGKYAGIDIQLRDGNYLIMAEDDILGIITDEKTNRKKAKA